MTEMWFTVKFVVDEVSLLQVFLRVLRFSHLGIIPPILDIYPRFQVLTAAWPGCDALSLN
jgi:hypothetical protein